MNTEPPQGDDLQRMLVSMKQNVLERATPLPKRRRGRSGIVIGVVALLAVGTATGAVALTLSQQNADPVAAPTQTQQPEPAPSATTPSSAPITGAPVPKPTPTPTPTPVASHRIPGLCSALVSPTDRERFFGAADQVTSIWGPDGVREADGNDRLQGLRDPEESLYCSWQNHGVISQLSVVVGHASPADVSRGESDTEAQGEACVDRFGGRFCQYAPGNDSGADATRTLFFRDDLSIEINQVDYATDGLLPAIVGEIWGD
jgi:hypothetical protein